jgi:hypothetical protein
MPAKKDAISAASRFNEAISSREYHNPPARTIKATVKAKSATRTVTFMVANLSLGFAFHFTMSGRLIFPKS